MIFSVENVVKVEDGIHGLLWLMLHRPRERYGGLVEWATAAQSLIAGPESPARPADEVEGGPNA